MDLFDMGLTAEFGGNELEPEVLSLSGGFYECRENRLLIHVIDRGYYMPGELESMLRDLRDEDEPAAEERPPKEAGWRVTMDLYIDFLADQDGNLLIAGIGRTAGFTGEGLEGECDFGEVFASEEYAVCEQVLREFMDRYMLIR